MQLNRVACWALLVACSTSACGNQPGTIKVINEYAGTCPLFIKTSEERGIAPTGVPLDKGETTLPPLRPGLLRVDFITEGIACGPEPCRLGPAGIEDSCVIFTAAGIPSTIVVGDVLASGCVQPKVQCPVPVLPDASVLDAPSFEVAAGTGTWTVSMAEPATGNGTVAIGGASVLNAPDGDATLRRITVNGQVGTTNHVLKVDVTVATGNVGTISHTWNTADGTGAGLALCSPAAPWPPCTGASVLLNTKTITLTGTHLGNPVAANGNSVIDARIVYP